MRYKSIPLIAITIFLQAFYCTAQESIDAIFSDAKEFVTEMEKHGFEVVHLDFDYLTESDNVVDTRRYLHPDYMYAIAAYGDPDRIGKLRVKLYEDDDGDWDYVDQGEMLEDMPNTSAVYITPEEGNSYMISVYADDFEYGVSDGRYFLIVVNQEVSSAVTISCYAEEDYHFNIKNLNEKTSNYKYRSSTFEIDPDTGDILHKTSYSTKKYTLVQDKSADETREKFLTYQIEDTYGKLYVMQIDLVNKTITVLDAVPDKGKNVFYGTRYYVTSE